MKSPGSKNEFAKKAKKMKFPLQTDNKDYGKPSKVVARTIDMVSTGDGKFYGSRTIMTKEHRLTFAQYLITESDINGITTLPDKLVSEIKGLIRKGAADLTQNWRDALHIVQQAYHVASVRLPSPDQKGAWKQYEDLIKFGVQQLAATRGRSGKWRKTDPVEFSEAVQNPEVDRSIGKHRFFVEIPGREADEVDVASIDELIELITNKIRSSPEVKGAKVRVDYRTKEGAILSVWVGDQKREEITIKELS